MAVAEVDAAVLATRPQGDSRLKSDNVVIARESLVGGRTARRGDHLDVPSPASSMLCCRSAAEADGLAIIEYLSIPGAAKNVS